MLGAALFVHCGKHDLRALVVSMKYASGFAPFVGDSLDNPISSALPIPPLAKLLELVGSE